MSYWYIVETCQQGKEEGGAEELLTSVHLAANAPIQLFLLLQFFIARILVRAEVTYLKPQISMGKSKMG